MELEKFEQYISRPITVKAWQYKGEDDCIVTIYGQILLIKTSNWIVLYDNKTVKIMTNPEFQETFEKAKK